MSLNDVAWVIMALDAVLPFNGESKSWFFWKRRVVNRMTTLGFASVLAKGNEEKEPKSERFVCTWLESCLPDELIAELLDKFESGEGGTLWQALVAKFDNPSRARVRYLKARG